MVSVTSHVFRNLSVSSTLRLVLGWRKNQWIFSIWEEKVFGTSRTQKNFQTMSRLGWTAGGTVWPNNPFSISNSTSWDKHRLPCRLFFALRNSKAAYALDRNRERHFSNCMFKSSIPDFTTDKDCKNSRRLCNSIELNRIYLVHGWFWCTEGHKLE